MAASIQTEGAVEAGAVLAQVRQHGYAINDEELELRLCSITVQVRGPSGRVPGALNVGAMRRA